MYYNIALGDAKKNFYFLLKRIIQCRDRDETGIPEPVGDEIQFLIPVGYG